MSELSASEALFGFMGWLTSLETPVTFSARDYAGTAAELVDEFCKANNLAEPRDGWHENFVYPASRPTSRAVDLGDSSAPEHGQPLEVLSAGQGESHPAPNH
jgi:hypothetical protein